MIKQRWSGAALAVGMLWTCVAARAIDGAGWLTAGSTYRTLRTPHLQLRFPADRELETREFAGRAEAYVTDLEKRVGFKYGRPIVVFLTERRYANAFVTGGMPGIDLHIALPLRMESSYFDPANFDGEAFQIFVHEVTHHLQYEMGRPWTEYVFGPAIPIDFILTPPWVWEGFAVYTEGRGHDYLGRQKGSFGGALLDSAMAAKGGLRSYDFSEENLDWSFSGAAQYTVGANFSDYLSRTFGEKAYIDFIQRTGKFTFSSDYRGAFGKSFSELLDGFNADRTQQIQSRLLIPAAQTLWSGSDTGRVEALTSAPDGTLYWLATSENDETYLYRFESGASVPTRVEWNHVLEGFGGPRLYTPDRFTVLADGHTLFFMTTSSSRDRTAEEPWLAKIDALTGDRERLANVDGALAAEMSTDGKHVWIARRVMKDGKLSLRIEHRGGDALDRDGEVLVEPTEITSVGRMALSPDGKQLALAGFSERRGGWGIYALNLDTKALTKLFDSAAVDYEPRWSPDGQSIYFVSDWGGHFDVRHIEAPSGDGIVNLCRVSNARWMTDRFAFTKDGEVAFTNRDGRFWLVAKTDRTKNGPVCETLMAEVARVPEAAPPAVVAQDGAEVYEESAWKTLIPVTRTLAWGYSTSDKNVIDVSLWGQSPYKKVDWSADLHTRRNFDEITGGTSVTTTVLYPFSLSVDYVESLGFFDDEPDPEPMYHKGRVSIAYPWYNHSISLGVVGIAEHGESGTLGLGVTHRFSSSTGSLRGAGAKRGLSLVNQFSSYPGALGSDDPLQVVRLSQVVSLPSPFSSNHSFAIEATELIVDRDSGIATGHLAGPSADAELDERLQTKRPQLMMNSTTVRLTGFNDYDFRGNKIVAAEASYTVRFTELQGGVMHLLDRSWLNPRVYDAGVTGFINAGTVLDGSKLGKKLHSATGAFLYAVFAIAPGFGAYGGVYTAQRLTDDLRSESGAFLALTMIF